MKHGDKGYLLDANVLIAAHPSYYAFNLCPGFWKAVVNGFGDGKMLSTGRVHRELIEGGDALTDWIAANLPGSGFIDDSTALIAREFSPLMAWVESRDFLPAAKSSFAADADGWLVATARSRGLCLVTQEARNPEAKRRVMIPDLSVEFGVRYCNTFEMLQALGCAFH